MSPGQAYFRARFSMTFRSYAVNEVLEIMQRDVLYVETEELN
jgi:hypothetical protein